MLVDALMGIHSHRRTRWLTRTCFVLVGNEAWPIWLKTIHMFLKSESGGIGSRSLYASLVQETAGGVDWIDNGMEPSKLGLHVGPKTSNPAMGE
jgi:hypothetical protein